MHNKPIQDPTSDREVTEIRIPITLFHHLLSTAPFGVLRGMGNVHVSACQCTNCRKYRKYWSKP
jgi:hypothetical protein